MADSFTMNKIAIALDIVRQYSEKLALNDKETKLYTIDGYGERVSFRDLVLGYLYAFCNIYGENGSWYGYPKYATYTLNILWGDGLIGWNRDVTNPVIDIPKALRIFEHLSAPSSSFKDKYARLEVFKKLFYRNGTKYHNYFLDGTDTLNAFNQYLSSGILLYNENPDFYNYCKEKIDGLAKLAANEAKNVSVPTKLKYLFDSKPVAKMYDAAPEDESYKDGMLNINSVVIQANQFYLTFLTSFEQILYQYTRQTFPLKLLGTMSNLYSSYTKLIVNYLKPYHARLIDTAPIIRFGNDLQESVMVGDQLEYNLTQQIYTDVYEWNFDNPYDWRPENYDQMKKIIDEFYWGGKGDPDEEKPPFDGIDYLGPGDFTDETAGIHYQLIDEWRYNYRIDEKLWYTDKFDKDLFEDFNVIIDSQEPEVKITPNDIPVEIYPSILYTTLNKYECLGYDPITGTLENLLDRDLIVITRNYCTKDQYRIYNIGTGKIHDSIMTGTVLNDNQNIDTSASLSDIDVVGMNFNSTNNHINETSIEVDETINARMMIMLDDILHGYVKVRGKWVKRKMPVVNDIFNGNKPPAEHMNLNPSMNFNSNSEYLNELHFPNGYHNFIRLLIYLPAHGKAILPSFNYTCRIKHYT